MSDADLMGTNSEPVELKISFKERLQEVRAHFLWWPCVLTFVIIVSDQYTKMLTVQASDNHPFGPPLQILVPGWFNFVDYRNTGAAWGMFGKHTEILGFISFAAFFYFLSLVAEARREGRLSMTCLSLLLGGIMGNGIDRVFRREVVDMIEVFIPVPKTWVATGKYQYPAFNIADAAICVAVGLYLLASAWQWLRAKRGARPSAT